MRTLRTLRLPVLLVAVVALVAALGGTAAAARLLTGKDIRNSSLTGADIKNRTLTAADFKGSVTGARGAAGPAGAPGAKGEAGAKGDAGAQGPAGTPDGYTKSEADATFLGKSATAGDASRLDGVDGDDYVAGDAQITFNALDKSLTSGPYDVIEVGDLGKLTASCAGGTKTVSFVNTSGITAQVFTTKVEDDGTSSVQWVNSADGGTNAVASSSSDFQLTMQISRAGANANASADLSTVVLTATDALTCKFVAHTTDSERDASFGLAP